MGALASVDVDKHDVIVSRNPATGEVLGEVREASASAIRDVVSRARGAQAAWGALPVKERCTRVARFRDLIVARAEELCTLLSAETGKTRAESLSMEVMVIADLMTYFCKRAPRILAPEPISLHLLKNRGSYLHYQPRGVVGIISPWNFPFGIATGEMAMALIAGNAVVLKPSEVTPLIALKTKELYDAAGLPPDLFQVTPGRRRAGEDAVVDAAVD